MSPASNYGLILLVFNALPTGEEPADPNTTVGRQRMRTELEENLIDIWEEMRMADGQIPVLLVSFPGYESLVNNLLGSKIALKFPSGFLEMVQLPLLPAKILDHPEKIASLVEIRQKVGQWLSDKVSRVVMVRPFTNHGATVDRGIFEYFAAEEPPTRKGLFSGPPKGDFRPVLIETVPFDGRDGPIAGLYKTGGESRPALLPSAGWKAQGYHPQAADMRATGTLYFNLPMTRFCLNADKRGGMKALEQLIMANLAPVCQAAWNEQAGIFESALSNLATLLKFRPLNCGPERGERGYRNSFF